MLESCIWTRPGCPLPQSSGTSTSAWPVRWRSSRSGTRRSRAPTSPRIPWPTWPVWVWSTSATMPSSIRVSIWRWPSLSGGMRPCLIMSVKYYLSLARFPDNNELSTDYDITRVAEDVTYSDASSSSVVYCAPVNGREIMWRGFICVQFSFFRPTLCKHYEWMSINLLVM